MGYIQLTCWSNGFHGKFQRTEAIVNTIGCLPQTDGTAPLFNTTRTKLNECETIALVPHGTFMLTC